MPEVLTSMKVSKKERLDPLRRCEVVYRDTMLGQYDTVVQRGSLCHCQFSSFGLLLFAFSTNTGIKQEGTGRITCSPWTLLLPQRRQRPWFPELPIEMWAHILSIVIKEASQSTQAWREMIPLALVCRDWFSLVFSSLSEVECDTQRIPRTYLPFLFRHAIYLKELILLEGANPPEVALIAPLSTLHTLR